MKSSTELITFAALQCAYDPPYLVTYAVNGIRARMGNPSGMRWRVFTDSKFDALVIEARAMEEVFGDEIIN